MILRLKTFVSRGFAQVDKTLVLFVGLFALAAIIGRFVVHLPNFTPIAALALFSGYFLPRRFAIVLPLAVMFLCDLFIGFYTPAVMLSVYLSFIAIALLGGIMKTRRGLVAIASSTLAGSLLFFVVTNAAVWAFTDYYAHTFSGLLYCFTLALPFLKYSLLGDFFWVSIFFGSYAYFTAKRPQVVPNLVPVRVNTHS